MKKSISSTIFLFIFLLASCTQTNEPNESLKVITSIYPVYDFVKQIGGERIDIHCIMPAGQDAHEFEITPKQVLEIESSDIFFYSGLGIEPYVSKLEQSSSNNNLEFIEIASVLKSETVEEFSDPHIWLDPQIAKEEMRLIKDTLISLDSENKAYYENNFEIASKKIDELDESYRNASYDFQSKDIVVQHEAYGFLCRAYGLNQIPLSNINASGDISGKDMADIIDYIRDNDIKAVFYESDEPSSSVKILAEETNADMLPLNPFETLSQNQIDDGEDYFSIMYENLASLKEALD